MHLAAILKEALGLHEFQLGIGTCVRDIEGGLPDITVRYKDKFAFVIQLECPRVHFKVDPHPAEDSPNDGGNRYNAAMQAYAYMVTKNNLAYGLFTNYDKWVFLKRTIVNNQQVLQMSAVFEKDRARLALAAFIMKVIETPPEQLTLGVLGAPGFANVVSDEDYPDDASNEVTATTTTVLTEGARRRVQPSAFFDVGTVVAGFTFTTTKRALGIKSLSLHARTDSIPLKMSERGSVLRYQAQGHDFVWRQLDVYGLPRHCADFSLGTLQAMVTREIETYMHLRGSWGVLIPRFVYFGMDFAMLWAFVTSYKGVDLRRLSQEKGGLSQTIKTKARDSLIELHSKEVIHGDVAIQNVLLRENDGNIIWIDFGHSEIGGKNFVKRAKQELQEFDAELGQVPTLPETETSTLPSANSPSSKRSKIHCAPECSD